MILGGRLLRISLVGLKRLTSGLWSITIRKVHPSRYWWNIFTPKIMPSPYLAGCHFFWLPKASGKHRQLVSCNHVAGVLAPYLFIICLDYVFRTLIDKIRENGFELTKKRSRRYPAKTITDADYTDDIAILANTPDQAKTPLHSLERAAAGIGLYVNAHKTEYMCYNQTGDISTLDGIPLKLVDKFTYLGSSFESTEKDINTRLTKAWTAINRLSIIWRSDLTDKMKHSFFQAAVASILLYGCNLEDTLEKWYAIKFCFKLGKNATETYGMLQTAFGASCMNWASVFGWHKRFREDRESVRDDEKCGRSKEVRTPELIGQIKNFMDEDHCVSIETIRTQFDVSVGTVHTIIREELKMRKICAKFVPRVLREDQKERRFHDSREMVELINSDPTVLDALVTCNESWIYCYEPETKRQSSQWEHAGSPRPKKARQSKSTHKLLMIPFLTALAWSICTGFPLDRQSTRNTKLRF